MTSRMHFPRTIRTNIYWVVATYHNALRTLYVLINVTTTITLWDRRCYHYPHLKIRKLREIKKCCSRLLNSVIHLLLKNSITTYNTAPIPFRCQQWLTKKREQSSCKSKVAYRTELAKNDLNVPNSHSNRYTNKKQNKISMHWIFMDIHVPNTEGKVHF